VADASNELVIPISEVAVAPSQPVNSNLGSDIPPLKSWLISQDTNGDNADSTCVDDGDVQPTAVNPMIANRLVMIVRFM